MLTVAGLLLAGAAGADNATCLGCHGNEGFEVQSADGKMRPLHVRKDKFESSVHGKRDCAEGELVAKMRDGKGHPKVQAPEADLAAAVKHVLATK